MTDCVRIKAMSMSMYEMGMNILDFLHIVHTLQQHSTGHGQGTGSGAGQGIPSLETNQ
jgi:hypothetical protein